MANKFDSEDYYVARSWKPVVKKYPNQELWYVSRRRKSKASEYLSLGSQWQGWADYFTSEADAQKALDQWVQARPIDPKAAAYRASL
jgi:hypothetical protein